MRYDLPRPVEGMMASSRDLHRRTDLSINALPKRCRSARIAQNIAELAVEVRMVASASGIVADRRYQATPADVDMPGFLV